MNLSLIKLFFQVKWFLFQEGKEVRRSFPAWASYERAFRKAYRFRNPYRICKTFLQQKGEKEGDVYGETPLPVYAQIARECALCAKDTVIDLGCGRGRGVFFLNFLTGCRAIGIDWVPFFIQTAERIAQEGVSFRCEELLTADLSEATVIYLYGTCLSEGEILSLASRFQNLPERIKIITVSYPLSDYSPDFQTLTQFTAQFPWGRAEVYFQQKNNY